MRWIKDFQLFLFDFDGLLVNTEHIHYQAYVNMCERRGFRLDWTFSDFCNIAHIESSLLKDSIYAKFPDLLQQEPHWEVLYREKKRAYMELLLHANIEMMPGAAELLEALAKEQIEHSVVTNSAKEQVDLIIAIYL